MKIILSFLVLFSFVKLNAQCTIQFSNNSLYTCANSLVTLSAVVPGSTTLLEECNFNSGVLPVNWSYTGGLSIGQPCGNNLDISDYGWLTTSMQYPSITSPTINFSNGGTLSFDLRLPEQSTGVCDGPDSWKEGVEVQYSKDNGLTWNTFKYFNPNGNIESANPNVNGSGPTVSQFNTWQNYIVSVPADAVLNNTLFKWCQTNTTGNSYDNWGIDNIQINAYPPIINSSWSTGVVNTNSISVFSNVDTFFVFTVYDGLGIELCTDTSFMYILPNEFDNQVELVAQTFTANQSRFVILDAFNNGCDSQDGEIEVVLDPNLSFVSSVPPPDVINGDTLIYNFTSLEVQGSHFIVPIKVKAAASLQVGDSVSIDVKINEIQGDIDPLNNIRHYIYPVLASYDPNDKKVYPLGDCIPGYVLEDQKLTYTVRFQNTGSAPAVDVILRDSIDANLDISALKIVASSDDVYLNKLGGNVVEFKFDEIYLPTQNANNPGSIGYVVFEIEPKQGLAHDTELKNFVDIFFDYNPPIRTNEVMNTISDGSHHSISDTLDVYSSSPYIWRGQTLTQSGIYTADYLMVNGCDSIDIINLHIETASIDEVNNDAIQVFPNPTNEFLFLKGGQKGTLLLVDFSGKTILNEPYLGNKTINVSKFDPGFYSVIIVSDYKTYRKKIVINH